VDTVRTPVNLALQSSANQITRVRRQPFETPGHSVQSIVEDWLGAKASRAWPSSPTCHLRS